jgi:hypothetical protein
MWERIGAATGIAFVAFLLASFFVIPDTPPALDDPTVTDALATRIAAEADQAVIRALYDVQAFAITFTAFPIAALVGAVTIA